MTPKEIEKTNQRIAELDKRIVELSPPKTIEVDLLIRGLLSLRRELAAAIQGGVWKPGYQRRYRPGFIRFGDKESACAVCSVL